MLSFGTEHIQWLLEILLLGREKLLFMRENQGLHSWVAYAMKTWQVCKGILATSLMFRAGIFIACNDRSRGSNRGLLDLQASMGCPCSIGEQKWKTMKNKLVIVSLFGRLSPSPPFSNSSYTLLRSCLNLSSLPVLGVLNLFFLHIWVISQSNG